MFQWISNLFVYSCMEMSFWF